MSNNTQDWQAISVLLDELLELSADQQREFLHNLPPPQQHLRARLHSLAQAHWQAEQDEFMSTIPKITLTDDGSLSLRRNFQPDSQIGPWRLLRKLGEGGMASVWLAVKEGEFRREVALKLPHADNLSERVMERFARERDILAQLVHPHIARLYDAGMDKSQQSWLALEFIEGMHIQDWCHSQGLDTAARVRLMVQACSAVQYAHSRLVVHRDLKPSNILVTSEGYVRLLDFGIAHILQADAHNDTPALTEIKAFQGKPVTWRYASPEQLGNQEIGITTDVYALGVVLYELLTGHNPYQPEDRSRRALEQAILHQEPAPASSRVSDRKLSQHLRGDLDAILHKALQKTPELRYPTAHALASDLRRYLNHEPVSARPDSFWYRSSRFVQRYRTLSALSVLLLSVVLSSSAVALYQANKARQEADRAQAMYQFVLRIFNPEQKPDPDLVRRDLSLKDLVATGIQNAVRDFSSLPMESSKLTHDLGQLAIQLGLSDAASTLYEHNLALAKQVYGDQSSEYAHALIESVDWLASVGQHQRACQQTTQALAIFRQAAASSDQLAQAHRKAGLCASKLYAANDPRIFQHLEQAITLARHNANRNELGYALVSIAMAYLNADQTDKALAAYQEALQVRLLEFGENNWQTAEARQGVAICLDKLGRPAESSQVAIQAMHNMEQVWGKHHYRVSEARLYIANVLADSTQRSEALQQARTAYDIVLLPEWRTQKPDYLESAQVAYLRILLRMGNLAQMLQVCRDIDMQAAISYPRLRLMAADHCGLARAMQGETEIALQHVRHSQQLREQYWPDQKKRALGGLLVQGALALRKRDFALAAQLYRQSISYANNHADYSRSLAWRELARLPVSKTEDDLRRIQAEYQDLQTPQQADYWRGQSVNLQEALGWIYLQRAQYGSAITAFRLALQLRASMDDPVDSVWQMQTRAALQQALEKNRSL
ncbi:serine/threonine-protein kinase [Undibacterium rugosum]|uniref:Serine/threonine protein kinase n=4 Tax=Undibacterium TaxID=401469 RepID=A0A923I2C5_9BURK|nr:serine/threonine-protein kinase [Undibacterium rugosum]MBC3934121.1 serine/threonine protein kinase [Undibacterium rugosum]MBR7779146.1 serine/threonine protein kinase [Undibacterium rugosum]